MKNNIDFCAEAEKYGTPLYIFDMDILKDRIEQMKAVLGERIRVCYAIKANPMLLKYADRSVGKFEVCSPGEFEICKKIGISPEKIVYSGVYKDRARTPKVLEIIAGRGIATAESLNQLELINEFAQANKKTVDVLLRVTSGTQFGMDEETVRDIIKNRQTRPYIHIHGIQLFSGTAKRRFRTIEKELAKLDEFIELLKTEDNFEIEELEYGAGLPVNYFADDEFDEEGMLKSLREAFDSMKFQGPVTVELGRYIAASCGYYLTSVVDMKTNKGRNYIITDGGNHQMKYYGQNLGMKRPFFEHINMNGENTGDDSLKHEEAYDICGALCSVHDVIVRELPLCNPKIGDVLVFKNTGAYSVTEGMSLFLSRDIPAVVAVDSQTGEKLLRDHIETAFLNSGAEQ